MGVPLAEATKIKIGNANRGRKHTRETKELIGRKGKGKKLSPDHLAAIRQANLGRIPDADTRKKMSESQQIVKKKLVLDTQTGIFYFGVLEAAQVLGFTYAKLWNMLKGKTRNRTELQFV